MEKSKAPAAHQAFVRRFPRLGQAWDLVNEEGAGGPLDAKTQRLLKLAIAVGAMREGAVHSGVRKARDAGASAEEIEQVVALAASTIGFPSAVATWRWVRDVLDAGAEPRELTTLRPGRGRTAPRRASGTRPGPR